MKKRKYNDEEDHSSNNHSDDGYHLDVDDSSQLELRSPSPEAAIQLEHYYAETLTTRKHYRSSLYERLAISSINYNVGLSEVYELTPTMLDDQENSKIKE